MHLLRYRQIHLDFHTSPHIPRIGAEFDKKRWQETHSGWPISNRLTSAPALPSQPRKSVILIESL